MADLSMEFVGTFETFLAMLVIAVTLLSVGLIWVALRLLVIDRQLRPTTDVRQTRFEEMASELLEQGKLDELVQHAKARVETHPYHVDARWYLAVGYYHLGEMAKAVREFERVAAINPAWEEAGVAPFIDRISAVRDQAHSVAHH